MVLGLFLLFVCIMLWAYWRTDFEQDRFIDAIFVAMWVLFAIESWVTTDYIVYCPGFTDSTTQELWEPLYVLWVRICQPLGFVAFNAINNAFEIFTLCFMLKRFCPKRYLWLAILLFICANQGMMVYMCIKRQFLAQMVAIWALYLVNFTEWRWRWLIGILCVAAATQIHTSAIMAVGYLLLPLVRWRLNWLACLIFAGALIGSISFSLSDYIDQLSTILETLSGDSGTLEEHYGLYLDEEDLSEEIQMLATLILPVLLFVLVLFYNRRLTDGQYKLALLFLVSTILTNFLISDLARLNYYYNFTRFFMGAIILNVIAKERFNILRAGIYWCIILFSLYTPGRDFLNAITGRRCTYMQMRYRDFNTIFEDEPDKRVYGFEGERELP